MPKTSRAFVQASIVYLCLGALLGALLLVHRWLPLEPRIVTLKSSHVQMLVVGWLTQLILGVAWWLFPPLAIGLRAARSERSGQQQWRKGQRQRGSEPLFWVTFVCLNAGILLYAIFEPLYGWTQVEAFGFLAGIAGLFLVVAAATFVINMWARVRELGRKR